MQIYWFVSVSWNHYNNAMIDWIVWYLGGMKYRTPYSANNELLQGAAWRLVAHKRPHWGERGQCRRRESNIWFFFLLFCNYRASQKKVPFRIFYRMYQEQPPGPPWAILAMLDYFELFWAILGRLGHIKPFGPLWAVLSTLSAQSGPNGQEWPKWPRVAQTTQSGPKWPKRPRLAQSGPTSQSGPNGPE